MTEPDSASVIRASGGVVIRGDTASTAEVAVVHRPRYDDWTIPKGKADPGEAAEECAAREVHEETGLLCRVIGPAGINRYAVQEGKKRVDFFLMRPHRFTGFQSNEEVDEVRWIGPTDARQLLSYEFDRRLVSDLDLREVLSHTTIHLVRHGAAGDRSRWEGPDHERPLTEKGFAQANMIADQLAGVGITRLLSSPFIRCMQTLEPLGEALGLKVESTDALGEGASTVGIAGMLDDVAGSTAVLCSHGDVIPDTLRRLQWMGTRFLSPFECRKGSTWVVGHDGAGFTDARYLPPPSL